GSGEECDSRTIRRPPWEQRRHRRKGELDALAPVQATAPERALWIRGVRDPGAVRRHSHALCRQPAEVLHELLRLGVVPDEPTLSLLARDEKALPVTAWHHPRKLQRPERELHWLGRMTTEESTSFRLRPDVSAGLEDVIAPV